MPDLRTSLLPLADSLRTLLTTFGVARYAVALRRRTWSGGRPGLGTSTDLDVDLTTRDGGRPAVAILSAREIAGSGGTFRQGDLRILALTPRYSAPVAGGFAPAMLRLEPSSAAEEYFYVLTGDEGALHCTFVEGRFDDPIEYSVVVRRREDTP